jgi:hypothetical protein
MLTGRPEPYIIHIAVAAKNMPAQRLQVALTHLGNWNGDHDKLMTNLRVEIPSKVS